MSESTSKEQRRNLRKEIGETAAAAIVEHRALAQQVRLEHTTLARQMLEFEGTVATIRQSRSADHARLVNQGTRVDDVAEQLEALEARTLERLKMFAALTNQHNMRIARLTWWADQRAKLSRWQRFTSFFTGRCAVTLADYDKGFNAPTDNVDDPAAELAGVIASAKPLPWRAAHEGTKEQV